MPVTGTTVAEFLGQGSDENVVALASAHVTIVTELVRAYTRARVSVPMASRTRTLHR